jgi:hypothetical protein
LPNMEPLVDILARQKIVKKVFATIRACDKRSDKVAQFIIMAIYAAVAVIKNKVLIRIILIAGACLCLVIGVKWIAEDIVYQVQLNDGLIIINVLAFVPIIAVAPRYRNGKVIYSFISVLEAYIVLMGLVLTLR